ncbi:hypothetical protein A8W25_14570 [Streptomyces sp. ERV7]|nr:hypothetical protein A8W25_14570 [Streptomyces sp. ERV7]
MLTYRKSGDGVDEVAAHISKAQNVPDSTYPTMRNHAKQIPGKYLGGEGALHRIPYYGTEWRANRAEKDRACERRGRYRLTGLPDPAGGWQGKECDEYPFASTLEGANSAKCDFSVEAVTATQNSRAGAMLMNFYDQSGQRCHFVQHLGRFGGKSHRRVEGVGAVYQFVDSRDCDGPLGGQHADPLELNELQFP